MSAPGWYPDPERPGQQRYFDGRQWGPQAPERKPPASLKKVLLVIGVFALLAVVATSLGDDKPRKPASVASTPTYSSTYRTPTSTIPPGPSPRDLDPASYAPMDERDDDDA